MSYDLLVNIYARQNVWLSATENFWVWELAECFNIKGCFSTWGGYNSWVKNMHDYIYDCKGEESADEKGEGKFSTETELIHETSQAKHLIPINYYFY